MATIAPANFSYVNANGDKGDVQVLSAADITLLNTGLQDIEDLKLAIQKPLPSGTMIHYAGNVVPESFLVCNGAAVSRVTYTNLFKAIGTLYGAGDGSTTFNLPDARDRVLQGASATYAVGTSIAAGLPNITGGWSLVGRTANTVRAAYFNSSGTSREAIETVTQIKTNDAYYNLSLGNAIYSDSVTTVQAPAIASYILIKI